MGNTHFFELLTTNENKEKKFETHIALGILSSNAGDDSALINKIVCDKKIGDYVIESAIPISKENRIELTIDLVNRIEDEDISICKDCVNNLRNYSQN